MLHKVDQCGKNIEQIFSHETHFLLGYEIALPNKASDLAFERLFSSGGRPLDVEVVELRGGTCSVCLIVLSGRIGVSFG